MMAGTLRDKINTQHPKYGWLRVDTRTQREVEASRLLKPTIPIFRLARRANKMDRSFVITRDLDGAYRISNRLDGGPARAA